METIVSSGYTVLPTRHVAKAIINSILESPDDPKQRNQDSVGIRTMALLLSRRNLKWTCIVVIKIDCNYPALVSLGSEWSPCLKDETFVMNA